MTQFGKARLFNDDVHRAEIRVRFALSRDDMVNALCAAYTDPGFLLVSEVVELHLTRAILVERITSALHDFGVNRLDPSEWGDDLNPNDVRAMQEWARATVDRLTLGPVFPRD